MSTTQIPKIPFCDQVDDLIRCLKYINLLNNKKTASLKFCIKKENNARLEEHVTRKIEVRADKGVTPIVKGDLQLVPAILDLSFTNSTLNGLDDATVSYVFDSDIVKNIAAEKGKSGIFDNILAWYVAANEHSYTVDLSSNLLDDVSLFLQWKVYRHLGDETEVHGILHVHFPENDSWVVVKFSNITSESSAISIISETEGFVIDCHDLKFDYNVTDATFIDEDKNTNILDLFSTLPGDSLFNLNDLLDSSEGLLEEFKDNHDDGYIDADELEGEELNFLCGSEEDLESLLTLICHAAIPLQDWKDATSIEIQVSSSTSDGNEATIYYDGMEWNDNGWSEIKESLGDKFEFIDRAFEVALNANQPCGHKWEYNDGAYDRRSGYTSEPHTLSFDIAVPSAHEQICAKVEIKKLTHLISKTVIDGLLA